MKLEIDRVRAALDELQRVGLAGKTDLVIFRRRDRRQRRAAEHDRQPATLRVAHLDAALQRERRHAIGQTAFQVEPIEENAVGIRIRFGRAKGHLGHGVAELKTVRARQLVRYLAKPLSHAGHAVGLGDR